MTRLHLQIRSTSTDIQNAITQMQSKRHMQAHVCFYFLTTAPRNTSALLFINLRLC